MGEKGQFSKPPAKPANVAEKKPPATTTTSAEEDGLPLPPRPRPTVRPATAGVAPAPRKQGQ